MKSKINLITLLLFTIISFSTFASANFEITPDIDTLVPENTLMYFQISNPDELMLNLDNFLSTTGVEEILGNRPIKDLLKMLLESENTVLSLDYFNLSHPAGFAILPPSDNFSNSNEVEFMVFLPINNTKDILKLLRNEPEGGNTWYRIFMNYFVYFSSKELKDDFPSNNIIDLSVFDKYSNDSLSIYYDIQGLFKTFGDEFAAVIKELENNNSSDNNPVVRIIEGYFNILNEIDSFFSNIKVDRKGILLQSDMFFSKDTERLLSSFVNTKDIQKWGSYLPKEGLFQSIYSFDSKNYKLIMNRIIDYLFPNDKKDPLMLVLKQNMKTYSQYIGNSGAFSIDITPIQNENSEAIIPFDFSLSMVTELSDSDLFINEFRNFYSNQSINEVMNNFYEDSGFSFQLNMEEQILNGISPVFKLQYEIKKKRTKSGSNLKEIDPILNYLQNIVLWYHISDKKLYSYIGSGGIEGLKQLTLTDNKEKNWVVNAPTNSNLIWNVAILNILKTLKNIPEIRELLPKNNLQFEISGYTGIENGSVQSSTYISSVDIGNIFKLFKDMNF